VDRLDGEPEAPGRVRRSIGHIGQTAAVADVARQEAVIAAPVEELWAVLVDFERYPSWAGDLKHVEILERDADGRGVEVLYRAAAMGRSTTYVLRYDHSEAPHRVPWVLSRGDIMRRLDGAYTLQPLPDDPQRTRVVYDLVVDLVIPLPGFVKNRAEHKIIHTALRDLRTHVEGKPAGR
jgi:uncharacterized protein YndB with AHSA1/START domain